MPKELCLACFAFAHSMHTHSVGLQRSRPCPVTWDFRLSLSLGIRCACPTLMATTGQAADSASAATAPCQGVHGGFERLESLEATLSSFWNVELRNVAVFCAREPSPSGLVIVRVPPFKR